MSQKQLCAMWSFMLTGEWMWGDYCRRIIVHHVHDTHLVIEGRGEKVFFGNITLTVDGVNEKMRDELQTIIKLAYDE